MRPRRVLRRLALNATGLLVFVLVAFPVYWMVATAFKPGQEVLSYEPVWRHRDPTLDSFRDTLEGDTDPVSGPVVLELK